MPSVQIRARVTLTVEIEVPNTWGPDCPLGQVHRQAVESAMGMVERLRRHPVEPSNYKVIGDANVQMILVDVAK